MKTLISLALLVVLSASLILAKKKKNGKVNAAATKYDDYITAVANCDHWA